MYHFHFLHCRIEGNEGLKQAMGRVILKTTTLTRVTTQIQGQKVEGTIKYNHLKTKLSVHSWEMCYLQSFHYNEKSAGIKWVGEWTVSTGILLVRDWLLFFHPFWVLFFLIIFYLYLFCFFFWFFPCMKVDRE